MRSKDADGRLHVAACNISKATVNGYLGAEIPDWQALGLHPERIYNLLRDPEELKKAAPSFNNLPLLDLHTAVSADDPKKDRVVGSTGTDAKFIAPYLVNSLVIWDGAAIAMVESGEHKELSCAYRYRPDMTSGVYGGLIYDGIMRDLVGNHVALVETGRAGPDVVVGDSKLEIDPMSKRLAAKKAALEKALEGKLAADAKIDAAAVLAAMDAAEKDCEAEDEDETEEERKEREEKEAADKKAKDAKRARNKKARDAKKAKDAEEDDDEDEGKEDGEGEDPDDDDEGAEDKKAMDAAVSKAVRAALAKRDAIDAAKRAVRAHVGDLDGAFDGPADVYKLALDSAGIDLKGVEPSAYGPMVKMLPPPGAEPRLMAMDRSGGSSFAKKFPNAARINA